MQPYEQQYCATVRMLESSVTQYFGYLFGRVSSLTNEYHVNLGASRHEGLTRTTSGRTFWTDP